MPTDITFVLTSCGRFDLLAETQRTFVASDTAKIARHVVVEDSGDASVRDAVSGLGIDIDVIVDETRLGRTAIIDRAYRTVGTPYIFQCEDDCRYFRPGFVEESRAMLEVDPTIPPQAYSLGRTRSPGRVAPPASRNDPGPCGSGDRYEHRHGLAA